MMSSFETFGTLRDIESNWYRFERTSSSSNENVINYKIARDIDKLENLLQLLIYKFEKSAVIPDFKEWFLNLFSAMTTYYGISIRDEICKSYSQELKRTKRIKQQLNLK